MDAGSADGTVAVRTPVLVDLLPETLVRDVAVVVGGALLTAASAQLVIPLPFTPVPITGQTFAVLLTAAALGPLRGTLTQALYVLLGLGLPFYAEASSGPEVIFGATGGYLVAYPLVGLAVGWLARRGWDRKALGTAGAFLAGSALIYALGVPWLAVVQGVDAGTALSQGLLPFVPGDILKALLAAGLLPSVWRLANR